MSFRSFALPDPETQSEFYADVPTKRLIAWVVDVVLIALVCVVILPFTAFTGIFFFPALMAVVGFVYRVITLASGSATWGMRLVSIEMRRQTGDKFDFASALLHTIGFYVSVAMAPLQLISIVLMLTSARAQGLTDHVMGSVAINRAARY
ncbi:RDD family protein [Shimia aestuarii]|uniref:RDD family protein n=1 Tax=Shimia aestuarii TaxID=254406 RepID=A0A1I4LCL9_9RHOB|nr:RDD family protein [Shimia aestuarii]SFL88680.1 RDD family protein [Shimia aestuarii]